MPHMTDLLIVSFLLLFLIPLRTCNDDYIYKATPPKPGYKATEKFKGVSFNETFKKQWPKGDSTHQYFDDGNLTMVLDESSGSGFMSKEKIKHHSLYLGAEIMLPYVDYTAGLDISLFLSSEGECSGDHDEIDIEFLGSVEDKSYFHLQTNVLIQGHSSLNGQYNKLGREEVIRLWFDPRLDFHSYGILKTDTSIVFFVDDFPIRRFKNEGLYPILPLMAYGSIWNASDWATDGGRYKLNISYGPFKVKYRNFKFTKCHGEDCYVTPDNKPGLTMKQKHTMEWIQKHYLVYDYCSNPADASLQKECSPPR